MSSLTPTVHAGDIDAYVGPGILSLPVEILAEISLNYVKDHIHNSRTEDCRWLVIAHICNSWRAVVLHTPLIWAHVVLAFPADCVEMMLSRSAQAPLSVVDCRSCAPFIRLKSWGGLSSRSRS